MDWHRVTLKRVSIFEDLPDEAIFELTQKWARIVYCPKDIVVLEGSTITEMYFILRGGVNISIKEGFRWILLVELFEGAFFGESAMLCPADKPPKQTARVAATEFCDLIKVSKTDYDDISRKYGLEELLQTKLMEEAGSRRARRRWKSAINKVLIINRFGFGANRAAVGRLDEPSMDLGKDLWEGGEGGDADKAGSSKDAASAGRALASGSGPSFSATAAARGGADVGGRRKSVGPPPPKMAPVDASPAEREGSPSDPSGSPGSSEIEAELDR
jgi:CRP-like cAMP-binding protein